MKPDKNNEKFWDIEDLEICFWYVKKLKEINQEEADWTYCWKINITIENYEAIQLYGDFKMFIWYC